MNAAIQQAFAKGKIRARCGAPGQLASSVRADVFSLSVTAIVQSYASLTVKLSPIHFSHHNIDAAENYHHIGHSMAEAEVFEHGQIDETRRAHAIAVRVRSTVTDQVKTELTFGRLNAPISFANRGTKGTDFHLRVDNRAGRNLFECLLQNSDALAHFQHAHH